jgi:peptidoglycan/LPS O-acetylase OafA/YrhL
MTLTTGTTQAAPRSPEARRNNFDAVRIALATLVYLGHYVWILPHNPLPATLIAFLIGETGQRCVQAFFVISGFLMFQSFARSSSIWFFYERRLRRIFPGYLVVIFLSAALGLSLSRLPIHEYISTDLLKYLVWNTVFLNFMHPTLPGVFEAQNVNYVNGPLWTLKIEVAFYIIFPLLFKIGQRVGFYFFFCLLLVLSEIYVTLMTGLWHETHQHVYGLLADQFPGQLRFFVLGALFAAWRAQGWPSPFAATTLGAVLLAGTALMYSGTQMVATITLAAVVFVLCLRPPFLGVSKYGDLSYGIYIIHFPVLQATRALGLLDAWPIWQFGLVTSIVFGLSAALWHFIEGPALAGRWLRGPKATVAAVTAPPPNLAVRSES